MKKVAVIGGGAWGTALAVVAARAGAKVTMYTRRDPQTWREDAKRFISAETVENLHIIVTNNISDIRHYDVLVLAPRAQELRKILKQINNKGCIQTGAPILLCCKGIERESCTLMPEVALETLGEGVSAAVLSGPNFASEVIRDLPAACVVAAKDERTTKNISDILSSPNFRIYQSLDVTGVALGGALKNVIALACGMAAGKELGENAVAALITRALSEISRLAVAAGARTETMYGLAGLGDMLLTCTSSTSRNFSYGVNIAKGVAQPHGATAEGVASSTTVMLLAKKYGVDDLPICFAVYRILHEDSSIDDEIDALLRRPVTRENR